LFRRPRKKYAPIYYVNILAAIACVLGVISLMMPWVYESEADYNDDHYGLTHFVDDGDLRFGVSTGLIILGAFLVLIVRLFGIVQLAGALLFLSAAQETFNEHSIGYILDSMDFGFYVGLTGGIIGTISLALKPTFPVSERWLTVVRSRIGKGYRINVLSIAAAMIGILCVFLPWFSESYSSSYYSYDDSMSLFWSFNSNWDPYFMAAGALFLFGSVLCFISPLGGLSQLAGAITYLLGLIQNYHGFVGPRYFNAEVSPGLGVYVGVVASIIALSSIFYTRRLLIREGMFPISASESGHAPLVSIEESRSFSTLTMTRGRAVRVSLVCVVVFLLAIAPVVVAYAVPLSRIEVSIYNYDQELPGIVVVYIDDEVKWTLTVAPASEMLRSTMLPAGTHSVAVDKAIPGRTPENTPDGKIDWTAPIKVKPFIGTTVSLDFGYYGWQTRTGTVTIVADESRAVVTFDGFRSYVLGQSFPAEVPWDEMTILLTDSTSWVSWTNVSGYDLTSWQPPGIWHFGSAEKLGATDIWINATDLGANGQANGGDFFTLEPGSGRFDMASTYTVYIVSDGLDELMCKGSFGSAM